MSELNGEKKTQNQRRANSNMNHVVSGISGKIRVAVPASKTPNNANTAVIPTLSPFTTAATTHHFQYATPTNTPDEGRIRHPPAGDPPAAYAIAAE